MAGALKIPGVKYVLLAFFGYCALETTAGLWASSFLVLGKGIDTDTAARYASLFYLGITFGRFLCGFIAEMSLMGLVVTGLGCAPIYPSIIHATPANFGKENSQAIIGIQMASAYVGSTFMPPLFGLIANHINIVLYPVFLMIFAVLMVIMTELCYYSKSRC